MKRSYKPVLQKISEKCCAFLIAIPTMVLLLVCVYVVFVDTPLPLLWIVIISLTLKCAAYICEIFNTSLDAISPGEIEAARALGMNRKKTFIYIILPQLINTGLELYKNQFILNMQETAVVGYVALVDLTRASSIVGARTMDSLLALLAISVIYFVIGIAFKKLFNLMRIEKHIGV
jgi:ABC-type amino acid transport system permease subunit